MALARLNVPGFTIYSGSIAAGHLSNGKMVTIQDVYEAIGACAAGKIDEAQLKEVEDKACPGAGNLDWSARKKNWCSKPKNVGCSEDAMCFCLDSYL